MGNPIRDRVPIEPQSVDADGTEHEILRDNMPFGRPGQGELGTYFIGYARDLLVIERMIHNLFVGDPPATTIASWTIRPP